MATTVHAPRASALDLLRGQFRFMERDRALRQQIFRPPPKLTVSEWADRYRYLSGLASAEEGRWRTSRAPYQRGIMDAISDPTVQRVCFMAPSQVGKSEILLNTIGFYIDQDPSPMLMVRPSIEDARDFSEDRIKTMIAGSPALARRVQRPSGRREAGNKMLRKMFPGGHLTLVGANSATGLANRPIRVVLFDEIDKYPPSAGDKGDPITLASNRTKTFWNRKLILVTTPGVKGASRIEKEWTECDQRRFYVPCPHCGHEQHLRWAQLSFDDATYACESCAATIPETDKATMLDRGRWLVENAAGTFPGFHINALYSPWTTWAELIKKFLIAKRAPDTLQVFVNEDLAELWDPQDGEGIDADSLAARREAYAAEVPAGAGVLTAAIDVQRDRLELAVKGWGAGQESWLIAHHRIYGDPAQVDVWNRADMLLLKGYQHERGAILRISAVCIDSGDGQTVQYVYGFVAPRQKRGVFATKGTSVAAKPIINRPGKANKYRVKVVPIGTDTAKDLLFPRLRLAIPEGGTPPPGYMHFPVPQRDGGADDEYLAQFGREKVFVRHTHGIPVRRYERVPAGGRNEAIDLEVLNLAALHLLGAGVYDQLGAWVAKVHAEGAHARKDEPAAPLAPPAATWAPSPPRLAPRRPPGSGYINRWRG